MAGQDATVQFESKVDAVLVPVLVRDAQGHAVGTLKKEDFEVFDKDKPQTLTGFTVQKRVDSQAPQRFIIFLFDDLHLSAKDLLLIKHGATKMLEESLTPSDVAAVLATSGRANSGLTRDHAKLAAAIATLEERRAARPAAGRCPDVSYYQANLILNKNDDHALSTAAEEALVCGDLEPHMQAAAEGMAKAAAKQALAFGELGTHATLEAMNAVVKKMATLPGQHTLILISPGFLSATPEALAVKSEIMDSAAQANVTISTLDATGLSAHMLDIGEPSLDSRKVEDTKTQYSTEAISADEDLMTDLAAGTGGSYFHNNNDLIDGFRQLTQAPEYLYLLEFRPQGKKQDGAYHRLKVKVDQPGLKLQARRGYFAAKPNKKGS